MRAAFFFRQVLVGLMTVLGVATLVFILMRVAPGDPAQMLLGDWGDLVPEEYIQLVRKALGIDKPMWHQYLLFLRSVFTGEFGISFRTGQMISDMVASRFPLTLQLASSGFLVAILIGVPSGIVAAIKHNTWVDRATMLLSTFGLAAPGFWVGLFLIYIFAFKLGWFPIFGAHQGESVWEVGRALVLPALTVGYRSAALLARVTRTAMLEVLGENYVTTARSKGLVERIVVLKHALPNALGGSVITEVVFSRPGMGRLMVDGIFTRDYPVVQGAVLIFAMLVVGANLLTDILYGTLDPRLRTD
jgi:ABC-type dipeptide/oligopeptide/nickel transport system permease component